MNPFLMMIYQNYALNDLADGIFSTIEILSMRFFTEKGSNYSPSDDLRSVGRQAILKLLSIQG
jgi:hypothetical protein